MHFQQNLLEGPVTVTIAAVSNNRSIGAAFWKHVRTHKQFVDFASHAGAWSLHGDGLGLGVGRGEARDADCML